MKARLKTADEGLLKAGIEDGYQQGIATVLYVLDMTYGFKGKRLRRVMDSIQDLLHIRFGGHKILIQDMSERLLQEYGIDVRDIRITITVKGERHGDT